MIEPRTRSGRQLVDDWKHGRFTNPTEDILAIEAEAAGVILDPRPANDAPDHERAPSGKCWNCGCPNAEYVRYFEEPSRPETPERGNR
jgi:hypothetical protein